MRYRRTYQGLPVLGGDFVMHTAADGGFAGATGGLSTPLTLSVTPAVSAAGASATARARFAGTVQAAQPARLIVDAFTGQGRLAWESVVTGSKGQTPSRLHVITDAGSGAVLRTFDEVNTLRAAGSVQGGVAGPAAAPRLAGAANSLYSGSVTVDTTPSAGGYAMVDPSHGNGRTCDLNQGTTTCTTFADADNVWGNGATSDRQSAAVDAHYGAALTFDYFKNVHGRIGIFGNGAGVPSRVHYGNSYANAFWDGSQMTYGDGTGNARPLVSTDVAGHEMGHGITANIVTGGLTYSGESGGLNESASDIWGSMVEFNAGNAADPGDYLIGEKINYFGNNTPLRYMHDPKLDGVSKNCWYSGIGGIDVHYSSGVGNLAYFFLAQGSGATAYGTAPLCPGAAPVAGIGRSKAEKIWYRAMDVYFTSSTAYVAAGSNDARAATLQAAADLYGLCSTEYKTVQAAWAGVNVAGEDGPCTSTGRVVKRDFNKDGRADIALTGVVGWTTLPVTLSNGNGAFTTVNGSAPQFAAWASTPGAQVLSGDFNGDGRTDVALTGVPGWTTVPVALSNGNGTFTTVSGSAPEFGGWAATPGAQIVPGDFNGDGRTDIALTGVAGWTSVPMALSNGNGTFTALNSSAPEFASRAGTPGAQVLSGDFNGDGRTDMALTGVPGWTTVPVALSNGNGTFTAVNGPAANFANWATVAGARPQTADFNGDGRTDIALVGGAGWGFIPVAYANTDGTFTVTNASVGAFGGWATVAGAKPYIGDFNGDGRTDVALTGGSGWTSLPVAFSNADGTFTITNPGVGVYATWAAQAGAQPQAGDFNADGRTDIALIGGIGWASIPVAFSNTDGTFTITNASVAGIPAWATVPGAKLI